jgi:predicted transcriptional regulator
MTPQEAADKLGVSAAMWYYLKGKYAKDVQAVKGDAAQKPIITPDEIREQVVEMQNMGLTSLLIAQKLKIPLSMVNKYWQKDVLAPASDEDIPDTAGEPEEEEII